jgi:RecA-family ATPase
MEFDRDNDETTLIGNRWLCKGKQAVLQGPTGVGKSSLVMQWSIRLCLGIPFFGIQPVKEMCVMIIQAENDEGDMAEALQDMFDAMQLTNAEVAKVKRNLIVINNDRATGDNFRNLLRHRVKQVQPDMVFVDPLLAYVGTDD